MKRKIKKIFFKVISNSKIFNIIFFNEIVNDQGIPKLTGETRQRGDWTISNMVCVYAFYGSIIDPAFLLINQIIYFNDKIQNCINISLKYFDMNNSICIVICIFIKMIQ